MVLKKPKVLVFYNDNIIAQKIVEYKKYMQCLIKRNKVFFTWMFHVIKRKSVGYRLSKIYPKNKPKKIIRYVEKIGPSLNLRLAALVAGLLKNGHKGRARTVLQKVLILLTENSRSHSGSQLMNSILKFLEPPLVLRSFRRGKRIFYGVVPGWPSRRIFLAVKFLLKGAKNRQKIERYSFLLALYYESMAVSIRKVDTYAIKLKRKFMLKLISLKKYQNKRLMKRI